MFRVVILYLSEWCCHVACPKMATPQQGNFKKWFVDQICYPLTYPFIINTLLKDESDHIEGGDIVTNYYEFIFSMEEDGTLLVQQIYTERKRFIALP